MNLLNKKNNLSGGEYSLPTLEGFFRQIWRHGLVFSRLKMQNLDRAGKLAPTFFLAIFCLMLSNATAQTNYYSANGSEYSIIGTLPGDQVSPSAAISTNGGYVVWADNITDGDSWGISARKLDSTLSGTLGTFRVNFTGSGAQENPRVALLQNGGAAFVWQGGKTGFQHVYAGILSAVGTFVNTTDILVPSSTNYTQINPALAVLTNGNVVVVWSSFNQFGSASMQDVYGQILTASGAKFGGEFLINQTTAFNQRSPAVAALPNGGFVVTWVSEQQRQTAPSFGTNTTYNSTSSLVTPSVDIYARNFNSAGTPLNNEYLVNADFNACANPAVSVASDGSYLFAWTARDMSNLTNGLDIYARTFNAAGVGGSVFYVNSRVYGDEYIPKISNIGLDYLVTWTSLGQDGSREGVYGRFIHNNGSFNSPELLINTTTLSQQMEPCVAGDGKSQFLVVWRGFNNLATGFDLYAQRYLNMQIGLPAMSAPFVWAPFLVISNVYQPQLVVSWSPILGVSIASYEVYLNGSSSPIATVTTNQWTMTAANGLTYSSSNNFTVDYVTTDGRRSPVSPSAGGATWSQGNWFGVPSDWMVQYYGYSFSSWPQNVNAPLVPGGPSLYQVFISGGNPTNPSTWLRQTMTQTPQGLFLSWNTTPGATYQVIQTTNLSRWVNVGSPRFAASSSDSINVGGSSVGYYRIVLLRN